MTLTETPGIAALVVSSTTPVMLPRSDCAKERAGVARAAVASRLTITCVITIFASKRPGPGVSADADSRAVLTAETRRNVPQRHRATESVARLARPKCEALNAVSHWCSSARELQQELGRSRAKGLSIRRAPRKRRARSKKTPGDRKSVVEGKRG